MSTFPVDPSAGQVASEWKEIAAKVALLVRSCGRARFSECVEQVARELEKAPEEKRRRHDRRRNALKKSGVWYLHQELPHRPEDEPGSLSHCETFGGRIKLPAGVELPPEPRTTPACLIAQKATDALDDEERGAVAAYCEERERWEEASLQLFDLIKTRGFPNEENGDFPYEYVVAGWLPPELSPEFDPETSDPLPPTRELSFAEKTAALSAIHDAHLPSEEKIHPWAAKSPFGEDGAVLGRAFWYWVQVRTAKQPVPEWLPEVRLLAGGRGRRAVQGPRGNGQRGREKETFTAQSQGMEADESNSEGHRSDEARLVQRCPSRTD